VSALIPIEILAHSKDVEHDVKKSEMWLTSDSEFNILLVDE